MAQIVVVGVFLIFTHIAVSMYIPQDIEILEGYDVEESGEYYPQDAFYEARSLANVGFNKAIRNKRSPFYRVLESPGLHSHFHIDGSDIIFDDHAKASEFNPSISASQYTETNERQKRSENVEANSEEILASLPTPEKQVMESDFYRKGNWNVQSFNTDYPKYPEDEDPIADATGNDGMKGRTPRVNFITQPKKPGDENKERPMLPKVTPRNRFEKLEAPLPDMYPSRSYDPYLRRYDRFDDQYSRYDPYYEDYLYRRRYDPYDSYSPRTPSYPEPYYDYPDRRFDLPEPRDYRPVYSNDIYDRPQYDRTPYERANRRIIYYAHLPEIVRPSPPIDLSYNRYGRDRYDTGYMGPLAGAYRAENTSRDTYGFVKREKKDHRNYPTNPKATSANIKQERE